MTAASRTLYTARIALPGAPCAAFPGSDLSRARLETGVLPAVRLREGVWTAALWNRVTATECDFTQIDLTPATLHRCELGTLRMGKAILRGAALRGTRFNAAEL